MFFNRIFASVLMMAFCVQGDSGAAEMMVAFVCDRPAMHLADDRWIKDGDVGCLHRPNDILNYCRKVYPFADVERIEESKEKQTIGHWCRFGHVHCHEQFKVRPFRCVQAGVDDVISSYISKPSGDRQKKELKQNTKAKKNFNRYHTKKISKDNKDVQLEGDQQTTDAPQQQQQQQQQQTVSTRLITRRQTAFDDFLASTDDRNAPTLNVVRNLRRLIKALQRERIRAIDILYTHRNEETDFEGGRSVIATELQDVDEMLEKAMRRLDKMKQRKKIKLQIEDDLDNYHEFDDVISSLLQTSTTTSTTASPTTTITTSQDDDYAYDDDDDDDDDIMDSNRDQTNVTESKVTEKISEDKTNEEVNDENDYYDGEDEKYDKDNEEHKISKDAGRIFPPASAASLVESKPPFFSRLSGKNDDAIVYDDYVNAEGKRDADNFGQNTIRVKQSSLPKTSSRQGGKFDSALPLGISVSSLTVVVVIVVGIAVMRRRSRRQALGILKANESRASATPEAPRHVTGLQTVGYENPTYRYFEMRSE